MTSKRNARWLLVVLVAYAGILTGSHEAVSETASGATPAATSTGEAPTAGALRAHPGNPRWLTDDSGEAIVLSGSHTWSIFQDLEHGGRRHQPRYGSYRAWLSLLDRWNHNFTRGWIWEDGYYSPLPYRKSGSRWHLEQGNPAFIERLISRVREAESHGLFVSIMLFQGWSVTAKGSPERPRRTPDPLPRHPFTAGRNLNDVSSDLDGDGRGLELHEASGLVLQYQRRHVARLVEAMRPFDNIIWEIANEAHSGSLAWQTDMVRFIHQLESGQKNRHLVWMSCLGGGTAAENAALFASPADIVSPCQGPGDPYLDDPPASAGSKIVIADSDHIASGRVNRYWVWKSFLRGLHPVYMDLRSDDLPWYQGNELQQDPRIGEQIRLALGAVRKLAGRIPLAQMVPQEANRGSPVVAGGDQPPFALFTTDQTDAQRPTFDGDEILVLELSGGGTLEICGLRRAATYDAYWLRTIRGDRFAAAKSRETPSADPSANLPVCRRFVNPDSAAGKLLHLRRVTEPRRTVLQSRTVQ
jgi:hypothetical protein